MSTPGEPTLPEPVDTVLAPATRRSRTRGLVAGVVAVALLAGGVVLAGVVGDDEDGLRALPLLAGAGDEERAGGADAALYPVQQITFRLGGTLPDLGGSAPVYRLVAPALDEAGVRAMAATLGVTGDVVALPERGWQASGGAGTLYVGAGPGGWYVSFSPWVDDGSRDGSGSGGSTGSGGGTTDPDGEPRDEPQDVSDGDAVVPPPIEPDLPPPPANLPSEADAEQIARNLLNALGVLDGEWRSEVGPGSVTSVGVACAESDPMAGITEECAKAMETDTIVYSRSVVFHRIVAGTEVTALDWWVEVGDEGKVQSVGGTWSDVVEEGDYPLRPTADVYTDLVEGGGWYGRAIPLAGGDVAVMSDGVTRDATSETAEGAEPATGTGGNGTDASGGTEVTIEPVPEPGTEPEPVPEPGPTPVPEPEPIPEPEPVEVTITGAELGLLMIPAWEDGAESAYLVPSYRFLGTFADGSPYEAELPAIDESLVAPTTPPATEPVPLEPTEPTSDTKPTEPVEPVEPPVEPTDTTVETRPAEPTDTTAVEPTDTTVETRPAEPTDTTVEST